MWTTLNRTPFAVGSTFVCERDGHTSWVVAVRAGFAFDSDGRLTRLREQPPVSRAPHFEGDPGSSSLRSDTDFPYTKLATDVIVHASACPPPGKLVSMLDVGFRLGPIKKMLRVHGERTWLRGGFGVLLPSRAQPFATMPIRYERTFGGSDKETGRSWPLNPVGRGYAEHTDRLLTALVPNVEDPREPLEDSRHRPRKVAGLGALASHWQERLAFAGTYDEAWKRTRAPLWPEDFDPRFFQAAPMDQQVQGCLRGGEICVLHNLVPESSVQFVLPKLRILVETQFDDADVHTDAALHTVIIDAEARTLAMVWHAAQRCHGREHKLQQSVIRWEGPQTWAEAQST